MMPLGQNGPMSGRSAVVGAAIAAVAFAASFFAVTQISGGAEPEPDAGMRLPRPRACSAAPRRRFPACGLPLPVPALRQDAASRRRVGAEPAARRTRYRQSPVAGERAGRARASPAPGARAPPLPRTRRRQAQPSQAVATTRPVLRRGLRRAWKLQLDPPGVLNDVELAPGSVLAGYRLERVVSRTRGVHTVYEAIDPDGERVAVKLISRGLGQNRRFRDRFEPLLAKRSAIQHPHLLPLLDRGEFVDAEVPGTTCLYVVSRFVDVTDPFGAARQRPPDAGAALRLLGQVADGLDAAHARGLVHPHLTPSDILVEEARTAGMRS